MLHSPDVTSQDLRSPIQHVANKQVVAPVLGVYCYQGRLEQSQNGQSGEETWLWSVGQTYSVFFGAILLSDTLQEENIYYKTNSLVVILIPKGMCTRRC